MRKMKISTRLFYSFGLIIILLLSAVILEFLSISNIQSSKNRFANADAINENTQLTKYYISEYYLSNSDDSISKTEESYHTTRALMNDGLSIYKDKEEQNTIYSMIDNLDALYNSFIQYKDLVEKNQEHSTQMTDAVDVILSRLNRVIVSQKMGFNDLIRLANSKQEETTSLTKEMIDEYEELTYSSEAIKSILIVMASELQYVDNHDETFDIEVYEQLDKLKAQCDWLYNNFDSASDKNSVDDIRVSIDDYIEKYENYKSSSNLQATEKIRLNELSLSITSTASEQANNHQSVMSKNMTNALIESSIIGIISVILGVLLSILISKSIAKQLTTSINQLSDSANQVSSASVQLANTSRQLSSGSTQQAASIEETSATMEETASMVKQNALHTSQANTLSYDTSNAAVKGSSKVKVMNESMSELKKSSSEISKILKVIDDIAFQTNMLALNAAVEAARAGDAGLGFAVVAQEVRNLAGKSAKAAKDSAEIIDKNIELSNQGVIISSEVDEALEEIMTKSQNLNQIISDISKASDEQARGTSQVTQAIGEMEKVVQSNSLTADESAESAEELKAQAKNLKKVVNELSELVSDSDVNNLKYTFTRINSSKKSFIKKESNILTLGRKKL